MERKTSSLFWENIMFKKENDRSIYAFTYHQKYMHNEQQIITIKTYTLLVHAWETYLNIISFTSIIALW